MLNVEFGSLLFEPLEGEEDTRRAEERSSGAGAGVVAVRAGPGCAARAAAVAELLTAPACSVVSLSSSRADVSRQCTVSRQQTSASRPADSRGRPHDPCDQGPSLQSDHWQYNLI